MKIKTILSVCIQLANQKAELTPNGGFKTEEGKVTYKDIAIELDKLRSWCYPGLDTFELAKVVRCEKCKNYKTYKKTQKNGRTIRVKLCCIDMKPKRLDFHCANGKGDEDGE